MAALSAMTSFFADASLLVARDHSDDAYHEPAVALLAGSAVIVTLDLACYEVTSAAVRRGGRQAAERRLFTIEALAHAGQLVRSDEVLLASAAEIALEHGISAYDGAYVAAARLTGAQLVSCDIRDLVSRGLAVTPADALA